MSRALRIIGILAVVTVLLSACYPFQGTIVRTANGPDIVGSRKLVDKTFDLSGFTAVETRNGAQAEISHGDAFGVTITVDDNVADYLDVRQVDNRLVVGLKDGSYKNITFQADIVMPELTGVTAGGGSQVNFQPFQTAADVSFNSTGGASITGQIESGNAAVTAAGGADVTLKGAGRDLLLNHSGGGQVNLREYAVRDAAVVVTGGSHSEVNASGKVTGSVGGGGQVKVDGPATVEVSENGGGRVVR